MKYHSIVLILFVLFISAAKCSRILIVFNMAAPSHYILGNALARGLAEAGHDVTMVSPFEDKNPPKKGKYRDIVLTGFVEEMDNDKDNVAVSVSMTVTNLCLTLIPRVKTSAFPLQRDFADLLCNFLARPEKDKKKKDMNVFDMEGTSPFLFIPIMSHMCLNFTRIILEHPNFQKLIKSNEQFDAVIIEQFNNDALKALAHHYKAPLILFSTIGANTWVNPLVGNPSPPSYIPEALLSYTSAMSFYERVVNWLFRMVMELIFHLYFIPQQNKMMKQHFPDAPDLDTLLYNSSLILLNSHESSNQAVPHVPNMIDVGGFHVNPPKELPKDLKDFLDNAKEGVVYFSMGSNIRPSTMPKEKLEAILKALGKIKQKVLWKWDEDNIQGKPANIKLGKWFPQQDILAHPNVKLFITHGGLLSTTETIYHGVPILAFPIVGDQKMNAARAEMNGFGLSLAFSQLTEEKITNALDKLLNEPQYRENVKKRSTLMHDRPVKPLDLAVYWTEFVIRHKGAPHLRVAALDLPWYQYLLLDVISFVAFISVSFVVISYIIIKRLCCARRKATGKVKKN